MQVLQVMQVMQVMQVVQADDPPAGGDEDPLYAGSYRSGESSKFYRTARLQDCKTARLFPDVIIIINLYQI